MTTPSVSGQSAIQRVYTIKALTDIWTGDAYGKGERLITTGLLGSIRWWFEVLVRGLGGSACDPSLKDRKNYPRSSRCPAQVNERTKDGHHCVVCELFGCTGWARKFRFQVLDENDNVKQDQIKKDETVKFVFTALRPIREEEWALLDLTLRLIADYGAIGGRTVLKPSDESGLADIGLSDFTEQKGQVIVNQSRKRHHQDLGLIAIIDRSPQCASITEDQLRQHLSNSHWRHIDHDDFAWASLDNFWCVKGRYLARQNADTSTFNRVIGRPEPKGNASDRQKDSWLAGYRATHKESPASKKVFSFKEPAEARRTFGFVQGSGDDRFGSIRQQLTKLKEDKVQGWQDYQDLDFLTKAEVLSKLGVLGA